MVATNYPSDLIKEQEEIGANGIITNKLYTRVDEFEDAIKCALGFISNKYNFRNK